MIHTEKQSNSILPYIVVSNEVSNFGGFNNTFCEKKGVTHSHFVVPVLRGVIYVI